MKKLTAFAAVLAVAAMFLATTGCEEEKWGRDEKIVGVWKEINPKYYPYFDATFRADGIVYFTQGIWEEYGGTGYWSTHGDTLAISIGGDSFSVEYTYHVIDNRLWLVTYDNYEIQCLKQ